jgi:predicted dehydrogenase
VARERRFAHHAVTDDLAAVPWLDQVDAVTIATAPGGHYQLARQALQLGKHVLTEKPFTMTVAEGDDLVSTARTAGRQLAIVHNFQFARSMQRLKADLQAGRLGTIASVRAVQLGNPNRRLPVWYEELPLGLFYDESPHLLYLMRCVAGPLRLVRALTVGSRHGLKTPGRIDAYFAGESASYPVTLHCNFESPVSEWYLIVFGTDRLAIVDVFRDIYISLPNDGTHDTARVVRTSIVATAQHWLQHFTSGWGHITGRLVYGNDEVFGRFARAIEGDVDALVPVGPESALAILKLQHDIIERHEDVYG